MTTCVKPRPRTRPSSHAALSTGSEFPLAAFVVEIARILEDVVGHDEAEGFISLAGSRLAHADTKTRRPRINDSQAGLEQLNAVLSDLRKRIHSGFRIVDVCEEWIELTSTTCPFGVGVRGHSSLCALTSTLFGRIAADTVGYAKVALEQTLARGDAQCQVRIHLRPSPKTAALEGQDYVEWS